MKRFCSWTFNRQGHVLPMSCFAWNCSPFFGEPKLTLAQRPDSSHRQSKESQEVVNWMLSQARGGGRGGRKEKSRKEVETQT